MGEAVVAPALASLRGYWDRATPPQVLTYLVGAALIAVGLAHLAVWAATGGPWLGPLGWRKPTTFGVSFGLTTVTLGWMTSYLPLARRTAWWLLGALAAANTSEVAWVSLQRARGVPSHFNTDTALDTALCVGTGVAILVTIAVIVTLTWRAFRHVDAPPSMRVALRAGLVVLLVSMAVGGTMIGYGLQGEDAGRTALTTFGTAGIMKVPHAVGMHAIQVLPGLAWLLTFGSADEARRVRLVVLATAGYALLVTVSLLQTFTGVAPWDLGIATGGLLLAALATFAMAGTGALSALRAPRPLH